MVSYKLSILLIISTALTTNILYSIILENNLWGSASARMSRMNVVYLLTSLSTLPTCPSKKSLIQNLHSMLHYPQRVQSHVPVRGFPYFCSLVPLYKVNSFIQGRPRCCYYLGKETKYDLETMLYSHKCGHFASMKVILDSYLVQIPKWPNWARWAAKMAFLAIILEKRDPILKSCSTPIIAAIPVPWK